MDREIRNLSVCASGSPHVPALPRGFCVAITKNGLGIFLVTPSTVHCRSSMTSRRADWVLGEVRFSSSASSRLQNTFPGWYTNSSFSRLYTENPVRSDAITSGVN